MFFRGSCPPCANGLRIFRTWSFTLHVKVAAQNGWKEKTFFGGGNCTLRKYSWPRQRPRIANIVSSVWCCSLQEDTISTEEARIGAAALCYYFFERLVKMWQT